MSEEMTKQDLVEDAARAIGKLYDSPEEHWEDLINDAKAALRSLGIPAAVLIGLKTGTLKAVSVDICENSAADGIADERDDEGNFTTALYYGDSDPIVVEVKFHLSYRQGGMLQVELMSYDKDAARIAGVSRDTVSDDLDDLIAEERGTWAEKASIANGVDRER